MATVPKVFISATSRDLASSRDIVRLAANDMEWMPVEQKHFDLLTESAAKAVRAGELLLGSQPQ